MGTAGITAVSSSEVEVMAKPVRRRFTGEYKLKILGEAEASSGSGQIGALLRREGLYSSNLTQKDGVRSWILYFTYHSQREVKR